MRLHTGVGHIDRESAQHFLIRKSHKFACAPDGIRTSDDKFDFFHAAGILLCTEEIDLLSSSEGCFIR